MLAIAGQCAANGRTPAEPMKQYGSVGYPLLLRDNLKTPRKRGLPARFKRIEFRAKRLGFCYPLADSRDIVVLSIVALLWTAGLAGRTWATLANDPVGGLVAATGSRADSRCDESMDVILKVLDGAKIGAKVAVKKDQFLIGRSSKCHLCAGSTAVSRKHCAILRDGTKVSVKDLGSRNGTLVNDKKIDGEFELSSGDEITVGPLRFLLTISLGIKNGKRPQVKSVAEAVDRTVESADYDIADDDISRWLLEPDQSPVEQPSKEATETQTISLDDTNAVHAKLASEDPNDQSNILTPEPTVAEKNTSESAKNEAASDSKTKDKKGPGKLPAVASGPSTKDSRDAAAAALRNWNRKG